ncbi:ABC transporter permease [Virgibacillus dakarensis]|nr:ABC transporter permease [Virgibacillus dakarensis]
MQSIVKHIIKNLIEKKLRTAIVLLAIILSTAVLFIGLSVNQILNDTYTTMVQGSYGNANIVVTKASDHRSPFYQLADLDISDVGVEQRVDMINATGKGELNSENLQVSMTGMDLNEALTMELVKPINKVKDFKLNHNTAMISQKTASDFHLSLGDTIKVSLQDKTYKYTVGAISETNGVFYSEIDTIQLVVSKSQLNKVFGKEDMLSSTLLQVSDEDLDKQISRLSDQNPAFSIQKASSLSSTNWDDETFMTAMILAIVIIVLISAYVISSLAKIIIAERMPVVGTFRSLGTSKRKMNGILLLEFILYGGIGAGLGIGLGCFLLPSIADFFNEYKEFGVATEVEYRISFITAALVFGMLFPACVSMLPILKANRKQLKAIILNTPDTVQERSIITEIIGVFFFVGAFVVYFFNTKDNLSFGLVALAMLFIAIVLLMQLFINMIVKLCSTLVAGGANGEMTLGIKSVANNKLVANNSSMIIVVVLLLMVVGITSAGLDHYISDIIKRDSDVMIGNLEKDPAAYEQELAKVDGVSDISKQYIGLARYQINRDHGEFGVVGIDNIEKFNSFYSGVVFKDDAMKKIATLPNGVIIDQYQAGKYDVAVGDTIQFLPLTEQGKPLHKDEDYVEMVVAGLMDSASFTSSKSSVLVNLQFFNDYFDGGHNEIAIKVDQGYDVDQVKKAIKDKYVDATIDVHTFDELIASQKGTIDTLLVGIKAVILMGLIVGLLGITNNLTVSYRQRRKELAVLYSVCMSKNQIVRMLFYEMVMTFIAVVVIGCAGGLLMNVVLTKFLHAIGLVIQFDFNYSLFALLCGLVFVLLALSTLSIVRKIVKMNVLDELRYE